MESVSYIFWMLAAVGFYIGVYSIPDWTFSIGGFFACVAFLIFGYACHRAEENSEAREIAKLELFRQQILKSDGKCPYVEHHNGKSL